MIPFAKSNAIVAGILAGVLALALLITATAPGKTNVDRCPNAPEVLKTPAGAHERAAKGWNRKTLKKNRGAIQRVRTQARCVPTKNGRQHVQTQIDTARYKYKKAKFKAAKKALYNKITSAPGQARLAVLRQCESTNRYNDPSAPAGAYGMLQGWSLAQTYYTKKMRKYFGNPSSPPYTATPDQQDILASLLYQHHGTSPWECPF